MREARLSLFLLLGLSCARAQGAGPDVPSVVPRFSLPESGLALARPTRTGAFFDVVGRRSAVFGYENRGMEAWVWPLKLVDDFRLAFRLEGYPLDIEGPDVMAAIEVRPEATLLTYSHAAFTVRQIVFAPLEEPGIVMLLDVRSVLPMSITGSFRPRLSLMWPAGLMTGHLGWDEKEQHYSITEETRRFAAVIGSPGARDLSVMPYQEEPRDVPIRFVIEVPLKRGRAELVPIVVAGSVDGREKARDTYRRLLASARERYGENVAHYRTLSERTAALETPDEKLNTAFAWAKVGMDKGLADNPFLGRGLVAGFRTSGESERPGFAWFFGRDALWTAFALVSAGDLGAARTALEFLGKYQRADGKVPHEISQSASLIPWFTEYAYPWHSADATPLYVIAHADYWRAGGDRAFLESSWDSILRAWRFTAATDTDGNGLVENAGFGHGWVEGGDLYPAHEEIYLQGLWIEACRSLAELATARKDPALAAEAGAWGERTRTAVEKTYWQQAHGFYAFATQRPRGTPPPADRGPNRAIRQARLEALAGSPLIAEDTVLPAVPMWWGLVDETRARSQIDHFGAAEMATDWGHRILSSRSPLYDPLSYHHGSVWPLFTGWAAMAAYRYGRPHVGHQAALANAHLTFPGALGYVTELLSGDFHVPFGRSSHHQVWSEAMVVTPIVRGLFGIEAGDGGHVLTVAPQLPATWDRAAVRNVAVGATRYDVQIERSAGRMTLTLSPRGPRSATVEPVRFVVAPAFPLDARVRTVTVDGRAIAPRFQNVGDIQRAEVRIEGTAGPTRVVFTYGEGTDVEALFEPPGPGAASRGLRVLSCRPDIGALRLTVEGVGGRTYLLRIRTPRRLGDVDGLAIRHLRGGGWEMVVPFTGSEETYSRRELVVPLR